MTPWSTARMVLVHSLARAWPFCSSVIRMAMRQALTAPGHDDARHDKGEDEAHQTTAHAGQGADHLLGQIPQLGFVACDETGQIHRVLQPESCRRFAQPTAHQDNDVSEVKLLVPDTEK